MHGMRAMAQARDFRLVYLDLGTSRCPGMTRMYCSCSSYSHIGNGSHPTLTQPFSRDRLQLFGIWFKSILDGSYQSPFLPRKLPNNPTMATAMPPSNSHMALSVGEPVKNRDTSELKESMALTPHIIRTTPMTSSATDILLFVLPKVWRSKRLAAAYDTHQDDNDRDYEEDMNESVDGIGRNQSQQP